MNSSYVYIEDETNNDDQLNIQIKANNNKENTNNKTIVKETNSSSLLSHYNPAENKSVIKFVDKSQREQFLLSLEEEKQKELAEKVKTNTKHLEEYLDSIKFKKPLSINDKSQLLGGKRNLEKNNNENDSELIDKEEIDELKNHYLHGNKRVYKAAKTKESRFKPEFKFKWDESDDTSKLSLGKNLVFEPKLSYGKGKIAGVDDLSYLESKKEYDNLLEKRDKTFGFNYSKDFYNNNKKAEDFSNVEEKPLSEMTSRDWKIFRENNNILVKSDLNTTPLPIRNWNEAKVIKELISGLKKTYKSPTAIQMQAIPIGLERKDLMGISPTGTGKSAAFLIPLIHFLIVEKINSQNNINSYANKREKESFESKIEIDNPSCLILAPTRDLAQQIEEEFIKLTGFLTIKLKSVCLVGGKSIDDQYDTLNRGVDLVVGAPGRVKDCIQRSFVNFENCSFVIIDEADKMIKEGFEEDLRYILDSMKWSDRDLSSIPYQNPGMLQYNMNNSNNLNSLSEKSSISLRTTNVNSEISKSNQEIRTIMMFSATMSSQVQKLAKLYLKSPAHIQIIREEQHEVVQLFENVKSNNSKFAELRKILSEYSPPIMIFVNHKATTTEVLKFTERYGYRAAEIHGDKNQDLREKALKGFKRGDYDILVSTSLMGRGIDVDGVTLVINFDAPTSIDDYEHRIGRTGRAGKKGTAITFVSDKNSEFVNSYIAELEKKGKEIPEDLRRAKYSNIIYVN